MKSNRISKIHCHAGKRKSSQHGGDGFLANESIVYSDVVNSFYLFFIRLEIMIYILYILRRSCGANQSKIAKNKLQ